MNLLLPPVLTNGEKNIGYPSTCLTKEDGKAPMYVDTLSGVSLYTNFQIGINLLLLLSIAAFNNFLPLTFTTLLPSTVVIVPSSMMAWILSIYFCGSLPLITSTITEKYSLSAASSSENRLSASLFLLRNTLVKSLFFSKSSNNLLNSGFLFFNSSTYLLCLSCPKEASSFVFIPIPLEIYEPTATATFGDIVLDKLIIESTSEVVSLFLITSFISLITSSLVSSFALVLVSVPSALSTFF